MGRRHSNILQINLYDGICDAHFCEEVLLAHLTKQLVTIACVPNSRSREGYNMFLFRATGLIGGNRHATAQRKNLIHYSET